MVSVDLSYLMIILPTEGSLEEIVLRATLQQGGKKKIIIDSGRNRTRVTATVCHRFSLGALLAFTTLLFLTFRSLGWASSMLLQLCLLTSRKYCNRQIKDLYAPLETKLKLKPSNFLNPVLKNNFYPQNHP
jgi:hypothetical protein